MKNETKVGRAWIVTYQSYSDRYRELNNQVVSTLKWQKSPYQIMEHITQLYVDQRLFPSERVSFLRQRHIEGLIYEPKLSRGKNNKVIITIGHNPVLEARQVKNLNGKDEKWSWDEI